MRIELHMDWSKFDLAMVDLRYLHGTPVFRDESRIPVQAVNEVRTAPELGWARGLKGMWLFVCDELRPRRKPGRTCPRLADTASHMGNRSHTDSKRCQRLQGAPKAQTPQTLTLESRQTPQIGARVRWFAQILLQLLAGVFKRDPYPSPDNSNRSV